MRFESIPEREKQVLQLIEYFRTVEDGAERSWLRIEADTEIVMDPLGRNLVRRALRKLKRPYEALRGEGVRMSAPESTLAIMGSRFGRIDRAVRRADRTRGQLVERHFDALDDPDKQRMLVLAGFFGAVRAFAREASVKLLGPTG